ncbi:MAG: hypothetical protein HYS23_12835 [Geobacter sp.]|nr:hypothetical protein [Geobacter sp.]
MRRLIKIILVLATTIIACSPVAAQVTKQQQELRNEVETKMGKKVRLFHSGTQDVKKVICIGDVIPVYREVYAYGAIKRTEVGRIKVLSYLGEHYLEAEIVEGKIRRGDVAQKESAACLVHPAPDEE